MNLKWMICPLMISLFFLAACSPSSVEPSVNPSDMTSENSMPAIDTTPAEEEMATPEPPGADFFEEIVTKPLKASVRSF